MKISDDLRIYGFPNGSKLIICNKRCRVVPNFGGGQIGFDISREDAVSSLVELRKLRHISSLSSQ